jgi:isoleucyl-tRNA synthetase
MRWLYASAKPEQNLLFGYTRGNETRRRFLIPLWNVYAFFVSYARLDGWLPGEETVTSPDAAHAQMDDWIVERMKETTLAVRASLDKYDAERATRELEALLDDLSNWYVRRSRRRFWKSEADDDKSAAYSTLYQVLVDLIKLLAPFVPFMTEAMYQNLVVSVVEGAPSSIHHTLYPDAGTADLDERLLAKMRLAITTASLGRAARGSADIKLRQPLASVRVNVGSQQEQEDLLELAPVLKEEINVKDIEVVSEVGELVDYKLLPNNRVLGPRLGKMFPAVNKALQQIDPAKAARTLQAGQPILVEAGGQAFELGPDDVLVQTESRGGLAVASDKGVTVAVDTTLTPALLREGVARDVVRALNNMRKEAGFDISDRILVVYKADGEAAAAIRDFSDYIQQETLAVQLDEGGMENPVFEGRIDLGSQDVLIGLRRAD